MKCLAFACACAALLICAAPQARAQIGPRGRPQPPFPGATPGSSSASPDQEDDRDRRICPANFPRPIYLPPLQFRPAPAEPHLLPVESPFKTSPLSEFHAPTPLGGAGKVGAGALAAIGAALAGAFRALFGFRPKNGGEA